MSGDLVVMDEAYTIDGLQSAKSEWVQQYSSGGVISAWGYEIPLVAPPAPLPHQCPHGCKRDRHPDPLTREVAQMYDSHQFREDYSAEGDDSPIVCVGAGYHGPNRAVVQRMSTGTAIGESWIQIVGGQDATWTLPNFEWPKWEVKLWTGDPYFSKDYGATWQQPWVIFKSEPLEPCEVPDGITVTFDGDWKPWEKATTDTLDEWQAARKGAPHIAAAARDFPVPKAPGYDFSQYAEADKKPYYLGAK